MAENPWYPNSPKLPFCCNDTPKMYFAAETGDFNLYVRPIPKYNFQRQSFTNAVTQCLNIVQLWYSIESRTCITAVSDRGFTNTLQD